MTRQLLVIDDDPSVHRLVKSHLSDTQTQCLSALDGTHGLQLANDQVPDAILLDLDMPGLGGLDVCRQLKSTLRTRDIPVMFLTGDHSIKSKVTGIELGALDYVTKPVEWLELRARVGSAFRMGAAMNSSRNQPGIDQVTGLWNRAYLLKQIEAILSAAQRAGIMVGCSLIKIDRFDEVAQHYGSPGGTDLIREVAEAVSDAVRVEDIVGRYDTRTIAVLGEVRQPQVLQEVAMRIQSRIGEIGLRSFLDPEAITASIGMVVTRLGAGPRVFEAAESALREAGEVADRIVMVSLDQN